MARIISVSYTHLADNAVRQLVLLLTQPAPSHQSTCLLYTSRDSFGFLPVPTSLPPFLRLEERGLHYILLEDLLLSYADQIFDQFTVTEKAVVAVTRNADISPEDESYDVDEDFRQHMRKLVKKLSLIHICSCFGGEGGQGEKRFPAEIPPGS